jgi:molybdopterin-containing oxidoreductase family iron-sulfur binding subunit
MSRQEIEIYRQDSSEPAEPVGWARRELAVVPSGGPSAPTRRDFLRLAGFAVAGSALAGCQRGSVKYAVPALAAAEGIVPGRSYEYASTCGACSAGCGLLVKNIDGRPIKLEGNPEHPLSRGGLCAVGQASILGLYDQQRLQHPLRDHQPAEWAAVDQAIVQQLDAIRKKKGAVRFLTGPIHSPTMRAAIDTFLESFADARHVVYDTHSCSAILDAHGRTHGKRLLPHYHLDKAEVLVSFDADFLGNWISPVEFTAAYQAGRTLEGAATPRLSYHVQFESRLSLTGTKADRRLCVTPEELGSAMAHLAALLAKKAGTSFPEPESATGPSADFIAHLADSLWEHRQRGLVLCGSQDAALQVLCNFINHVLGNYGNTVDIAQASHQREGNDGELEKLLDELHQGKVSALFLYQSNPVHDLPMGDAIALDLKSVPLLASLAARSDETARLAAYVCPVPHYLETWGDAEPANGIASISQPAIDPLGKTRSLLETLAVWSGKPRPAYDLVREHWEKEIYPRRTQKVSFQDFWDKTVHDGFTFIKPTPGKLGAFDVKSLRPSPSGKASPEGTYSLVLYSKLGMPDASHAYNPWLQELPDPITKVTWDNYASLSPAAASKFGVTDGDVVSIETTDSDGKRDNLELPAFVQPGLNDRVVAVALGYGSVLSRRFADIGPAWLQARPSVGPDGMVGKNAAGLLSFRDGNLCFTRQGVRLTKTGATQPLASTQSFYKLTVPDHLSLPGLERRPIIEETTLDAYREKRPGEVPHTIAEAAGDLWPEDHPLHGPHWGMVIDLNACTGCSACVVACQVENNIPVVGKDEVRRQREMHWLRIDRYYTQHGDDVDVAHQPMLCQHCGNAPCEVVCPVLATVHSDEGLNEQVYNRCVGTRYCANNCPYKVRHFNWFDYAHEDSLQNLVLNPSVTIRSRGVMEKCTFCVQRIEESKMEARRLGRSVRDGDVQSACQQSCPAKAISFGNLNDPTSRVARLAASPRGYRVLEELNVKPSVTYLGLVRNRPPEEAKQHG